MSDEKPLRDTLVSGVVEAVSSAVKGWQGVYGRVFYTPAQWAACQEKHGLDSEMIIVHDGPPLAPYFNPAYECDQDLKRMREAVEATGHYVEQCTVWYSAVYKSLSKQEEPQTVMSVSDKTLIDFHCGCGYKESIGVGFHAGIVLEGSLVVVCPSCGAIYKDTISTVMSMTPLRVGREKTDDHRK